MEYKLNGSIVGRGNTLELDGSGIFSEELDDGIKFTISGGGGGSPAGADTQIQYNNSSAFGADSRLTFDPISGRLSAGTIGSAYLYVDPANEIAAIQAGDGVNSGQIVVNLVGVQVGVGGTGEFYLTTGTRFISNQAAKPVASMSTQNGITNAATSNHSTDISGIITTTGTNDGVGDSVVHVEFAKAYPANNVPHITITPYNASAALIPAGSRTQPYVTNVQQTGFDIQIPLDAAASLNPSWSYSVTAGHN